MPSKKRRKKHPDRKTSSQSIPQPQRATLSSSSSSSIATHASRNSRHYKWHCLIQKFQKSIPLLQEILCFAIAVGFTMTWQWLKSESAPAFAKATIAYISNINDTTSIIANCSMTAVIYLLIIKPIGIAIKHMQAYKLTKATGIFYCRTPKVNPSLESGMAYLSLTTEHARNISILGATGAETFARPNSILHAAVHNASSLKIILALPTSEEIKLRAEDLKQSHNEYTSEIIESILFLHNLKRTHGGTKDISLKFYKRYPSTKIVISDGILWVQQYKTQENVAFSPLFAFSDSHKDDLYEYFSSMFVKRWNSKLLGTYNFDSREVIYEPRNGEKHEIISLSRLIDEYQKRVRIHKQAPPA